MFLCTKNSFTILNFTVFENFYLVHLETANKKWCIYSDEDIWPFTSRVYYCLSVCTYLPDLKNRSTVGGLLWKTCDKVTVIDNFISILNKSTLKQTILYMNIYRGKQDEMCAVFSKSWWFLVGLRNDATRRCLVKDTPCITRWQASVIGGSVNVCPQSTVSSECGTEKSEDACRWMRGDR